MQKFHLAIETGTSHLEAIAALQLIKDAMTQAMFLQIEATGITSHTDAFFSVWQSIYLQANSQLTEHTTFAAMPGDSQGH